MKFLNKIDIALILYNYRYLLGGLMLVATLVNCCARFFGEWRPFFDALLLQLWFGQAVFAYLRKGWVAIAPGGLGKDADPVWRAALAGVSFFIYLLGFFWPSGRNRSQTVSAVGSSQSAMARTVAVGYGGLLSLVSA